MEDLGTIREKYLELIIEIFIFHDRIPTLKFGHNDIVRKGGHEFDGKSYVINAMPNSTKTTSFFLHPFRPWKHAS
ncbi:MAG: hypothetical protein CL531_00320 [Aestuariibacter sp.]|nr:hypothetical protein [Aestuariibacter sp.]